LSVQSDRERHGVDDRLSKSWAFAAMMKAFPLSSCFGRDEISR
jgi:hypothetical protein